MSESENSAELYRVGTFNVGDMEEYLPERAVNTAEDLTAMRFGAVGLQEVTQNHIKAFDNELPNHINHFEFVYGHEKSGLMTLVDPEIFPESKTYRPNGRLADGQVLITELTSRSREKIVFVNRHLPQEVIKEGHRLLQTLRLVKYLESSFPNTPIIIAGDTNSTKAAPLNLVTRIAGYRSAHKVIHGQEPYRTYPSGFGDELLSRRQDGKLYEVVALRALRRAGNMLRSFRILDDDDWDSPHAGLDIDRVNVNQHVKVAEAGLFADDRQERARRRSDHLGVWAMIGVSNSGRRPQRADHS